MTKTTPEYRVEDASVIMVQTADGSMGTIEASWSTPGSANIIEIYGTDGAVIVDYFQTYAKYMIGSTGQWEQKECSGAGNFTLQMQSFVNTVRTGAKPMADGIDGLKAAQVVDAAYAFSRGESSGWAKI